jgi:hypothetical protein
MTHRAALAATAYQLYGAWKAGRVEEVALHKIVLKAAVVSAGLVIASTMVSPVINSTAPSVVSAVVVFDGLALPTIVIALSMPARGGDLQVAKFGATAQPATHAVCIESLHTVWQHQMQMLLPH